MADMEHRIIKNRRDLKERMCKVFQICNGWRSENAVHYALLDWPFESSGERSEFEVKKERSEDQGNIEFQDERRRVLSF